MSVATLLKGIEAGADVVDTAISSLAMGTSHSPTETIVEILKGTPYDTGLDVKLLVEIAAYFREVRKIQTVRVLLSWSRHPYPRRSGPGRNAF